MQASQFLQLLRLLYNDGLLSRNATGFLKELYFRKDPRLLFVLKRHETNRTSGMVFYEQILELVEAESRSLFDALFADCTLQTAKALSQKDRSDNGWMKLSTSFTYGEIDYPGFFKILMRLLSPQIRRQGVVFYDLGSGTARAVYEAMFCMDFVHCKGIELLNGLHTAALKVQAKFDAELADVLHYGNRKPGDGQCVSLQEGSILDVDWSDGDVVFANSTCFNSELMVEMSQKAELLKPGTLFICFTKSLSSSCFEMIDKSRHKMSWGPATVFTHRRLNHDGSSVGGFPLDYYKVSPLLQQQQEISQDEAAAQSSSNASTSLLDLQDVPPSRLVPGRMIQLVMQVKQQTQMSDSKSSALKEIKFLLRVPLHYAISSYEDLPMLVFLHGASARGSDFENLRSIALPKILNENEQVQRDVGNEALVLMPLCPKGIEWKDQVMCNALKQLIETVSAQFYVNKKRIYCTGISMGGLGTWMLAARYPTLFAALVPICGGGQGVYARLLKDLPMWFFHSADDNVVPVEDTDKLHAALLKEGSTNVLYDRLEDSPAQAAQAWMIGHNCWDFAYTKREMWQWLFRQKRELEP